MKRKSFIPLVIVSLAGILLLTSCGSKTTSNSTGKTNPTPVASSTAKAPTTGQVLTDGTTVLPDGLAIPPLGQPIPVAPGVPGYPQFSSAFVNGAYQFALGFVYKSYNMQSIWDPNTKKNPKYNALLKSEFNNLGSYLAPDMQQAFLNATPNLISPLSKDTSNSVTFNADAKNWLPLVLLPTRDKDGSLKYLSDPNHYSLMYPWTLGYSVGAPITTVVDNVKYGKILNVRFSYSIELLYGDQKSIKNVWKLDKTASFGIIANPDATQAKSNPYLIATWGLDSNSTYSSADNDPRLLAAKKLPVPSVTYP